MANTLAIVTDSSVDLPKDEAARLGIEVAPIQIAFSSEFPGKIFFRPLVFRAGKHSCRGSRLNEFTQI